MKRIFNVFSIFYLIVLFFLIYSTIPIWNIQYTDIPDFGMAYYRLFWWVFWAIILLVLKVFYTIRYNSKKEKKYQTQFRIFFITIISIVAVGTIKSQLDNYQHILKSDKVWLKKKEHYKKIKQLKIEKLKNEIKKEGTPISYYNYGFYCRNEGRVNDAIKYLLKANKLDSTNGEFHAELAHCLSFIEIGKYDEAIKHYNLAYKFDSTYVWCLKEINRCKLLKKQYKSETPR